MFRWLHRGNEVSVGTTPKGGIPMLFKKLMVAVGVLSLAVIPAFAQSSKPFMEASAEPITGPDVQDTADGDSGLYDPSRDGLVVVEDAKQLAGVLAQKGFCEEPKEERVPCAYIFYERIGENNGRLRFSRPIFRFISRDKIWTMYDGMFARVSAERLWQVTPHLKGKARTSST